MIENEQDRIRDLLKANPLGLTIDEVSKNLSISRPTTAKYLNALVMSGQADLRELGRAKLFYFSHRVPITKLLSLSTDLILILDNDLSIREISESALGFFNRELEELKGKRLEHSPIAPFFSADLLSSVKDALNGVESVQEIVFDSIQADRYFNLKCIPLVFDEGSQAVVMIFEDITQMKNYQHELEVKVQEQTAMIKRANMQMSLLTKITRHDIINQVTSLTAFIGLQKKNNPDAETLEILEKEEIIAETILRQIVFTRDYQTVGAEPHCWVNVNGSIQDLLRTVDRGAVDIQVNTGTLEVFSDPLIVKVFFNLIDNSLRHGERVTQMQISHVLKNNELSIVFEDNGIGIPDSDKEMIFTRGFGKHTGYGLFLVREILSMSDFTIIENGKTGKGARFVISVPSEAYRFS